MTFDATPGALVELEIYFDGVPDPHIIFWYGNETLTPGRRPIRSTSFPTRHDRGDRGVAGAPILELVLTGVASAWRPGRPREACSSTLTEVDR